MQILIIDDEAQVVQSLRDTLEECTVSGAHSSTEALRILAKTPHIDVILLDVMLGQESGLKVLQDIREKYPDLPCVMISGYASIPTAVDALRLGAWDYLEKPLSLQKVQLTLQHIQEQKKLSGVARRELDRYQLISQSPAMQQAQVLIRKAADSDLPVLIQGPSGSGKEHVAHLIHLHSRRAARPMIKLNCASIPGDLFESELFGALKGAYTGALKDRKGKIQQADQSTLFLDEIGELPTDQQAKLLRVLEDRMVSPLGSDSPEPADFRLVCATNRDLGSAIQEKTFREDLYYRIGVILIFIPALAQRREDIPLLAVRFLEEMNLEQGGVHKEFSPDALELLKSLPLPGNVRELRNLVQRACVFSQGRQILPSDLKSAPLNREATVPGIFEKTMPYQEAKHTLEREYIIAQLRKNRGNITQTAMSLGLLPNNLMRRMKALNIR